MHLFILKQAFVSGVNPKMGFGWSETKARPRTPNRKLPQVVNEASPTPSKPQLPYMSKAASVKHGVTPNGFACMEFRVRKIKAEGGGKPEEFTIQVLQNN